MPDQDRRPACPRCRNRDLSLQLDVQYIFDIARMEDGVLVLDPDGIEDIGLCRNPYLRCGDCGHVWRTRRRFEAPPHTVHGW